MHGCFLLCQGDLDVYAAATSVLNAICTNKAAASNILGTGILGVLEDALTKAQAEL